MTIPHGGTRVIMEWANRLTQWHDVFLYNEKPGLCNWFTLNGKVQIIQKIDVWIERVDCLIITSPHSIHHQDHPQCPKKVFIFLQMLEHMFHDGDDWRVKCEKFYESRHPMILISKWNENVLREFYERKGDIYYVGNGVNTQDFPIEISPKDGRTVLVEGWEGYNSAKDVDMIAPKVALRLRQEGYRVIAYGQVKLKTMPEALDNYYYKPSLSLMNQLYSEATILLKASRYDARACAPVEAMTKGTVTARAIIEGDDDLEYGINCYKVPYSEERLYNVAKIILTNEKIRNQMSAGCIEHVKKYSWDYWMNEINNILCQD